MQRREFLQTTAALGLGTLVTGKMSAATKRPNILWIVVEDASPHLGCYGERSIKTPNLDLLAAEGVKFENAFVTCPVCSPCRSALVTGMYQTTICSHNHRSQGADAKRGGNKAYYDSYQLPDAIPLVSDLFREAGYYVCNGADVEARKAGKTDYNFALDHDAYDGANWQKAPEGKPFFAQIQLRGGKSRPKDFKTSGYELPPYYPDDPIIHKDWMEYLGCWEQTDAEVGEIVQRFKDAGVYDNTVIMFLTDHGISHARDKQFLYEGGIRVPMIIRFPDGRHAGTVRHDLSIHIDLIPTSLALAGVPVPEHLQGVDLFAADYQERPFIAAARDRCDETLETIRCIRTPKYKYIRNFQSFRPHLQNNQYKNGKAIVQRIRELHKEGKLTPLQERLFTVPRPTEELYDVTTDPYETENLAGNPEHQETLLQLRTHLYDWMVETHDPGLFPEPMLEDLGKEYGSKYAAMQAVAKEQTPLLIKTIEAGEKGDLDTLSLALKSDMLAQRYWAATWLAYTNNKEAAEVLNAATKDNEPLVQVAAHLALCKLGRAEKHLPELVTLIDTPNLTVGMYAMDAIEQTGILNDTVHDAAKKALRSPYNSTQRYGKRLAGKI